MVWTSVRRFGRILGLRQSMNWPDQDRWRRLWQSVGASGDAMHWYETLTAAYAEPQRRYHNQQHIAECLAEFDGARSLAKEPSAVELALWFHDAVYDPKAADNEERSAAMAKTCVVGAGLVELAARVAELVMVTQCHEPEAGSDAAFIMDVDLSILGQDPKRFAEYEAQVREEYSFVPKLIFNFKRAQILQRFLDRPRIYATDHFASRYETAARHNLTDSIRKLRRLW
jgi:predicted metal-dependent HD superfamily phosphohydrolase